MRVATAAPGVPLPGMPVPAPGAPVPVSSSMPMVVDGLKADEDGLVEFDKLGLAQVCLFVWLGW